MLFPFCPQCQPSEVVTPPKESAKLTSKTPTTVPSQALAATMSEALTPEQRYAFDLTGYLVLRGVFDAEEVGAFNRGH